MVTDGGEYTVWLLTAVHALLPERVYTDYVISEAGNKEH